MERLSFDYFVKRRVYVPMTEAEVDKIKPAKPGSKGNSTLISILLWVATFLIVSLSMRGCSPF